MYERLRGRVAIVTGGGRGIGLAIARSLVGLGASVVVADSGTSLAGEGADPSVAERAAEELGGDARAFTADVASAAAARELVDLACHTFGAADIVVHCAAIQREAALGDAVAEDFDAVLRTNLAGAWYLANATAPVWREQAQAGRGSAPYEWGRLVNLGAASGCYGAPAQSAAASAAAGLLGLTRAAAMDLAPCGVTCNAILPLAATRMISALEPRDELQALHKDAVMQLDPGHVADAVSWLCLPESQRISGQLFAVRGRELLLFSQARPQHSLVRDSNSLEELVEDAEHAFGGHYAALESDLEAFSAPGE